MSNCEKTPGERAQSVRMLPRELSEYSDHWKRHTRINTTCCNNTESNHSCGDQMSRHKIDNDEKNSTRQADKKCINNDNIHSPPLPSLTAKMAMKCF